ncbi:sulfotransferase domain-containing protein [Salinibacter ruber]|uniref:sulfotransferase domain-containing protein n=1 Tax=Salinibacter ruber TaxID=146919 RepID=UPI002073AB41|nr:sulfotransferase domain-containing protein [Salinibacter ruber]
MNNKVNKEIDFLIIGAAKSATTSLATSLGKHESIHIPKCKEVHFFDIDDNWERGFEWYKSHFDLGNKVVGEATPSYLSSPSACYRIKKSIGSVKTISVLRDPIERAYSNYLFSRQYGKFSKGFTETIKDCLRKQGNAYRLLVHPGFYGWHIRRFISEFESDMCLILTFDELINETTSALRKIQNHIGVEEKIKNLPRENVTNKKPKSGEINSFIKLMRSKYSKKMLYEIIPDRVKSKTKNLIINMNTEEMEEKPQMEKEAFSLLFDKYKSDVDILSEITDLELSDWLCYKKR